jgi:hypothetical protein
MKNTEDMDALCRERQDVLEQYKRHEIMAVEAIKQLDGINVRLKAAQRGRKYADSDE